MFALAKMVDAYGSQVWTWIGGDQPTLFVAEDVEVLQARAGRERARPLVAVPEREIATFTGATFPDLFAFAMHLPFKGDHAWRWIDSPHTPDIDLIARAVPEDVALYAADMIPKAQAIAALNQSRLGSKVDLVIVPSYEVAAFRDSVLNKT